MKKRTAAFGYLANDGGPHLVLPVAVASSWLGVDPQNEDPLDPATDYGRACAVAPPIGVVAVGSAQALVFGECPPMSAWATAAEPGCTDIFVLHEWSGHDLDSLLELAQAMPPTAFRPTGVRWALSGAGAYLMSATDTVAEPTYELLHIPLPEGQYTVDTQDFRETPGVVSVFRLRPLGQRA